MSYTKEPMIFYTENVNAPTVFVPLDCFDIVRGMYMINRQGDVYSKTLGRIMKQDTNHAGYKRICLARIGGGYRNYSVHRLVAATFIINPNPDEYTDVNHINGIKARNHYGNLEWCSNDENKHLASSTGLYEHGEGRYNAVYTDALAHEICKKFQDGIQYLDVYNMYVTKENRSTMGSFIYKLYHRRTWNHITSQYKY